jgi:hypothetical protein
MKRGKKNSEAGQSSIEFALTLILLMAIILFYMQLTLVFAYGNYVHYATFMAARAYLSAGPSQEDQAERAKDVLTRMLGGPGGAKFQFIGRGEGGGDPPGAEIGPGSAFRDGDRSLSWMQGVRYSFRSRLFILPLGRRQVSSSANTLTLTSESWLGREPSFQECAGELAGREFDNGC